MVELYNGYKNYLNKIMGIQPLSETLKMPPPPPPSTALQPEPRPDIPAGLGKDIGQVTAEDLPKLQEIDKNNTATYQKALKTMTPDMPDYQKVNRMLNFSANRVNIINDISAGKRQLAELPGLPKSEFDEQVNITETIRKQQIPVAPTIPMDKAVGTTQTGIEPIKTRLPSEIPAEEIPKPKEEQLLPAPEKHPVTKLIEAIDESKEKGMKWLTTTGWDYVFGKEQEMKDPFGLMIEGGLNTMARPVAATKQLAAPGTWQEKTEFALREILPGRGEEKPKLQSWRHYAKEAGWPDWARTMFLGTGGELILDPLVFGGLVSKVGMESATKLGLLAKEAKIAITRDNIPKLQALLKQTQETIAKPMITGEVTAEKLVQGGVKGKPPIPEVAKELEPLAEEIISQKLTLKQFLNRYSGEPPIKGQKRVADLLGKAGYTKETKIGLQPAFEDFYAQVTGKVTPTTTKPVETPSTTAQIGTLRKAETIKTPKPSITATEQGLIEEARKYKTVEEFVESKTSGQDILWHSSPSGEFVGSKSGLHIGTHEAATQALEARIGIPADGMGWKGTSKYGDTLLAGKKSIRSGKFGKYKETGFNAGKIPEEDFYLKDYPELAKTVKYSGGEQVSLNAKPSITPVKIKGKMTNTIDTPMEDFKANSIMAGQIKKGLAKRGYFYNNVGEDAESISAVIPNKEHIDILPTKSQLTDIYNKAHSIKETPIISKQGIGKISPEKPPAPLVSPELPKPEAKMGKRNIQVSFEPDVVEQVNLRRKAMGLETKTIETIDDWNLAAKELGEDPDRLIANIRGNRIDKHQVKALQETITANFKEIHTLEKELNKPGAVNIQRQPLMEKRIAYLESQTDDAIKKMDKGSTELGRAFRMLRYMADRTSEPWFWIKQAKKSLGGTELTKEMRHIIGEMLIKKDKNALAMFVASLRKSSWIEKAITMWKAGLLTSPTTHLANITGNISMAGLETIKGIPATAIDIGLGLISGKRTTTVVSPWTKIKAMYKGAGKGVSFFKTGRYSEDILTKYDIPKNTVFKSKIAQGYTDAVFRSLGAEDIIFREAATQDSLVKQARVIVKNKGLSGSEAKKEVVKLLSNPTDEMVVQAMEESALATFQSDNVLSTGLAKARGYLKSSGAGGEALEAASQVVAPFSKTPTNIALRSIDYSPAGFVKTALSLLVKKNRTQRFLADSLGRNITGTGIMALGAYLGTEGILRGSAPSNPSERADFLAEGPANSIKVGGRWWSINRIQPIGTIMILGADSVTINKETPEKYVAATKIFFQGMKNLTEQTFLKGVSGGLKAVSEPDRFAENFVNQSVASTIPSIIGRIANTLDPTLRVPRGLLESIQARIPFVKAGLPKRRDVFGEPITVAGGVYNLIDPFASVKAEDKPLLTEAKRLGVTIGLPGPSINRVKLDNYEYSLFQKVNGKMVKEALTDLMRSPEYQGASKINQAEMFEKVVRNVRKEVRDELFPAIMIKKFSLPEDTNPTILKETLLEVNDKEEFTKLSIEKQGKVLKALIKAIEGNMELDDE